MKCQIMCQKGMPNRIASAKRQCQPENVNQRMPNGSAKRECQTGMSNGAASAKRECQKGVPKGNAKGELLVSNTSGLSVSNTPGMPNRSANQGVPKGSASAKRECQPGSAKRECWCQTHRECQTGVPNGSAKRRCQTGMSNRGAKWECQTESSMPNGSASTKRECQMDVPNGGAKRRCQTKCVDDWVCTVPMQSKQGNSQS